MGARRWLIFAFLFAVLFATALGLRRVVHEANRRLLYALSSRLEALARRGWQVDSVAVKVGAVHFYGVRYRGRSPYELEIDDVRIGYSFTNLIRSRFRPEALPNSVLLLRPHLTVLFYQRPETNVATDSTNVGVTPRDIGELSFLQNVVVSDGTVSYVDSSGQLWRMFDEVDGWIYRLDRNVAKLQLAARPRGSDDISVEAFGRLSLSTGRIDTVRIHIREYEIGKNFPFLLPAFLDVKRGRLAGDLILVENRALPQGFDLNGWVRFRNGQVLISGSRLRGDSIQFAGEVQHWNLKIREARLLVNGSPVEVSGSVEDLLDPRLNVELRSEKLNLARFVRELRFSYPLSLRGYVKLRADLTGYHRNPRIQARAYMPWGQILNRRIQWAKAVFLFADSVLAIRDVEARVGDANLRGQAEFDFRTSARPVSVSFWVTSELGGHRKEGIATPPDSLWAGLRGLMSGGDFSLTTRLVLHERGRPRLELKGSGSISTSRSYVRISPGEAAGPKLYVTWVPDEQGEVKEFELTAQQVDELAPYIGLRQIPIALAERADVQLRAAGSPQEIRSQCRVFWGLGLDKHLVVDVDGEIRRGASAGWRGHFAVQYRPGPAPALTGVASFRVGGEGSPGLVATLDLNDMVEGVLRSAPADSFAVELRVRKAPLAALFGLDPGRYTGEVDADWLYRRVGNERCAELEFRARKAYGHGVGPYALTAAVVQSGDSVRVDSLWIRFGTRRIVSAEGGLNLRTGSLWGWVRSDTLRVARMFAAFGAADSVLDGILRFWATVRGTTERPELTGELLVSDGRVLFEPFDLIRVAFSPADTADSLGALGVGLEQVLILRSGVFRLEGDGSLPLRRDAPIHLSLEGRANVLRLFADALGFLRNPQCDGNIRMRVNGTLASPRIAQLEVRFEKGTSEFTSVLPKVTEARGYFRLERGGFLHLVELSGKMGGEPFRISNARSENAPCAEPVEEFTLPALGASLGVFVFETGEQGVPLNLYGLQEKGEFGMYEFQGAEAGEKFVVAGPWEKPLIRGTWRLRDVSFQYPFIEGVGGKKNWVLDFLRRARWNLRLIAVRNVRYVRSIPSTVDNLYVNLLIDEGGDGVLLTGCPGDGTFRLVGRIQSTQGFVEYLDMNFRVESAGAEFDRQSLYPVVWGRARATVTDTTGLPSDIYLTVSVEDYSEERHLDELVRDRKPRGRWGQIRFQLTSDNPMLGQTEAEILASLGYSDRRLKQKAAEVVGLSAENWLFRPIVRPFEKSIRKTFGFDLVRFRSRIARNFIEWNLANQTFSPWYLMRSTRWEMGKYLLNNLFLLYTGEVETGFRYQPHQQKLGFRHTVGLEYRLSPDLILEMVYDYDSLMLLQKTDKRILLRHSFPF